MSKIGPTYRTTYSEDIPSDPLDIETLLSDTTEKITTITISLIETDPDLIEIELSNNHYSIINFCAYHDICIHNYTSDRTQIIFTVNKGCSFQRS